MEEIIRKVLCDRHGASGERVEGAPRMYTITGSRRLMDMCDPCDLWAAELVAPLVALLDKYGVAEAGEFGGQSKLSGPLELPVKASKLPRDGAGRLVCPGNNGTCTFRVESSSSMGQHLRTHPELLLRCDVPRCGEFVSDLRTHKYRKHPDAPR